MKERLCEKYGKKTAVMVFAVMLVLMVCLSGCGNAAPADSPQPADTAEENGIPGYGTGEQDADSGSAEAEWEIMLETEEVAGDADESVPEVAELVQTAEEARDTDDVQQQEPAQEIGEEADAEKEEVEAPAVDNRTEDEKLIDRILEGCASQATAETDFNACVVDTRTAVNTYEIEWNYGFDFACVAIYYDPEWDYVFDVEYYKKEFPMLALQHHYDDNFLKWHFTSVGMHEGRQGCADFNVKAFMDACPKKIREAFGDNYACYYLYWMYSDEVDRTADMSGKGCPKQMTAVLSAVQKEELDLINKERESLGLKPLVFDSELAAIANYRAWINAAENWAAHDWAKQNNDALWDMVHAIGGDTFSENTTSGFSGRNIRGWFYGYKNSPPHYAAMIDEDYGFIGISNVYACDNTLEEYKYKHSDTRWVQFDVFMGTLDTDLNPK